MEFRKLTHPLKKIYFEKATIDIDQSLYQALG